MNPTKSKTDIIFYTCLMLCLLIFTILFLSSCSEEEESRKAEANTCGTLATVKDFGELSTCGNLLVLDNGDILKPFVQCGTPPLSNTDDFVLNKLTDGMRVSIGYTEASQLVGACMKGRYIYITCIEEVRAETKD